MHTNPFPLVCREISFFSSLDIPSLMKPIAYTRDPSLGVIIRGYS
jgi:hypothetical protein